MPMDADRIRALYDDTLKARIDALEELRLRVKRPLVRSALLVGVPLSMLVVTPVYQWLLPWASDLALSLTGFVLTIAGVVVAGTRYLLPAYTAHRNYTGRFKREVVGEVFRIVCPGAEYHEQAGLPPAVFDEPGLFNTTGAYRSDDMVRGRIGDTPFEAAEVRRWYMTGQGRSRTTHWVFQGLFFHVDFGRTLRGATLVDPVGATASQRGPRSGLSPVTIADPAFASAFTVHASDPSEAVDLLGPATRAQLLQLRARTNRPTFLAFKGARLFIGVHYGRRLFEPGIASTTSLDAVQEIAAQFALAETIVRGLDVRPQAPGRAHGFSLLDRPVPPSTGPFDALAREGRLTEADVWASAKASAGIEEAGDGMVPRPDGTRIEIEPNGNGGTVNYGWSVGFFAGLALLVASLVVGAGALRGLVTDGRVPAPGWFLNVLPSVPSLDPYVVSYPWPWLIVATIVAAICALGTLLRVRRVVVETDSIAVYRGLRPWPRRYPRQEYGRVVRLERSVHLSRTEGVTLVPPTASPTLASEAEARWVAAEMQRMVATTRPT